MACSLFLLISCPFLYLSSFFKRYFLLSIFVERFFEHTLSEDIVRIMRAIRKQHLENVESMADTSIVDRMVAAVDEVAGFKGTPAQKFKFNKYSFV